MTASKDIAAHPSAIPMTRREWLLIMGASTAAALIPGAVLAQDAPRRGGVLRVAGFANPTSLDPFTGGGGHDHTYLWTIYDTLVEWDYETLEAKPGMAQWRFPDPTTLVLTISPGILFHDDTPCDAEAVKFNLDRARGDQRSNIRADLSNIASVEVSGPLEVTVNLARPDTALPAVLSDRAGMMCSPTAVRNLGDEHDRQGVGAGPWRLVNWADHQGISLVRHDKYWRDDRGFVDGIEFSIMPERATSLRSVVAGQNDLTYQLPPRLKPLIDRSKDVELATGPTLYCRTIWLNYSRGPLADVRVRQAMNFAIDREAIVKVGNLGFGEPAHMLLPSAHSFYDAEVAKLYTYDPDRARALLSEAGFKDGLELTAGAYIDAESVRRSEILMDQLGRAGIRLNFTYGPLSEIIAQYFAQEKKFDCIQSAWTGRPDPAMSYGLVFSKDAYFNAGRVEVSAELTDLLVRSREIDDAAARKGVFSRIQRIVMEQALFVPLVFDAEITALRKNVVGYKPNLMGKTKLEFVSLAQ